jgi:hypothetical protein
MNGEPYNPLDKTNLGRSIAEALLEAPVRPLADTEGLVGAGVYAIYYTGDYEAYATVAERNRDGEFSQPIYVGKAIPEGARKGGMMFDSSKGNALRNRLRNHARSIDQSPTLDVADFHFRSLVVDDVWIPLGESMMIQIFQPIWNVLIDGIGNNTPGAGRPNQKKSSWDMLHPGRAAFAKLPDNLASVPEIEQRIKDWFAGKAVPLVPPEETPDKGDE